MENKNRKGKAVTLKLRIIIETVNEKGQLNGGGGMGRHLQMNPKDALSKSNRTFSLKTFCFSPSFLDEK